MQRRHKIKYQVFQVHTKEDGSKGFVRHGTESDAIRTYLGKSELHKQMKACQKEAVTNKHDPKGRIILDIAITEHMPLELSILKTRIKSKEFEQCIKSVLQRTELLKHSLSLTTNARVRIKFF